ncbi:MAG: Holliday junction branch migration protein RuvA [Candidatus Aminicenantes bacterium]|nr:Holliday junction branch migration protein RuvA [Candidatus Aminicenantes bacterium]
MIAHLKGTLLRKEPHQVVVDCHGVGYAAGIPLSTFFKLGEEGSAIELLIHTHLTDTSLSLYGFGTAEEKDLFLKLIGISGIGPKLALAVLSGIGTDELAEAVRASDVARLSQVPGIGKKTALRIAMELADKLEKKESLLRGKSAQEAEDLVSALLNLGFRRKEIERVVEETVRAHRDKDEGFEKLLRECLKKLAKL